MKLDAIWRKLAAKARREGPMPIFVFTDIARDIDDALFLTMAMFLQRLGVVKIMGLVTTHMIVERRAMIALGMYRAFGTDVPIAKGSAYPIGEEANPILLEDYYKIHLLSGGMYEGGGLIDVKKLELAVYREPFELFVNAARESERLYGRKLTVFCLGPLTDFCKILFGNKSLINFVEKVYIQGSAKIKNGRLLPDKIAYNIEVDYKAAKGVVTECNRKRVPVIWVGKHLAYEMALDRRFFYELEETGHPIGKYLRTHAELGLQCFAARAPELFKKLYGQGKDFPPDDPLVNVERYSNPYDPTTMLVALFPEKFKPDCFQNHLIIGSEKGRINTTHSDWLRKILKESLLGAMVPAEIETRVDLATVPSAERQAILDKLLMIGLEEADVKIIENFSPYANKRSWRVDISLEFGGGNRKGANMKSNMAPPILRYGT